MNRLKAFFQSEKEKLRGYEGKAKAEYIWQYYKLWIIGIVLAVFLIALTVYQRLIIPSDNWFYITFANTSAEVDQGSELWQGFVDYSGYDTKEKNVYFNDSCYFDPQSSSYSEYYTYFVAYVEAGTLDLIAMERDDLEALGTTGRLLDLNREEADNLAEKYADRLIYAVPNDTEYSTEPVPIGIDLSDTCLVEKYHIYADSCAVGLSVNCPHLDAVEKFLDYIIEEESAS